MLSTVDLFHIKSKLEAKRARAKHDAMIRDKRAEALEIMFTNIPRQENMKKRTDGIEKAAEKIVEAWYGQE